MPSAKPKRGPCRHDQPDFVTIGFKHSVIFGKHGYTERARCFCGYSIRGASYDAEPVGDDLTRIVERMRRQGHGTVVVLSSVAGERVRKSNFAYGASKAGLDGFSQGLGDALEHGMPLERLGEEVVGAVLHRGDGGLDGAVGGHQHHFGLG